MMDAVELLSLIACPVCRGDISAGWRCHSCDRDYPEQQGRPQLFPGDFSRDVHFTFHASRAVLGPAFRAAFVAPPVRGAAGSSAPHHLDRAHQAILHELPVGARILEIGCGGGQMRQYLTKRGLTYVGVDISAERVSEELQRHGGPDLLCDGHFLPFKDQTFDLVYSAAVTEHLACPTLVAKEIARVLRPGGYYLGNVSFLEAWHDDSFFHMSPLGVFEFLSRAEFDVLNLWPGEGYSGFSAIFKMGNRVTGKLSLLGDLGYLAYRWSNRARAAVRQVPEDVGIYQNARVAGAIDWIARRPLTLSKD